jgi:hypothetical protein
VHVVAGYGCYESVQDLVAPAAIAQDVTVTLDEVGSASLTAAQVNSGSTDNCEIVSLPLSTSSFTCAEVGENDVVLTVADVNGNSAIASAVVTVEDITVPVVATKNTVAQLDASESGSASIAVADVNDNSAMHVALLPCH